MTNWLTYNDVENYGPELTDFSQRAALHAVTPQLQLIAQDNQMLRDRLARESRHRLDAEVERAVPNYKEIDVDPRWHRWLLSVDTLSGRVRQQLLNEAILAGNAARVITFFRTFQQGGGTSTPAATWQRSSRSAPIGQRTYTREQIADLYSRHRRGEFDKRESYWKELEADIFQAQHENKIIAHPYLTK